jgi:acyl carrier protein
METMSGDIGARVREILADVLQLDPARVGSDAALGRTPGWDSANHINLVLALEEEFAISLDVTEIETMLTFDDVVQTIEAKF